VKVAQVVECSAGGTGRHVLDLTEGLAERGHDISLLYSTERMESKFRRRLERLRGVKRYMLPFRRVIGLHDARHVSDLAALLRRIGPFDVVHGHSSKAGALVRLLPASVPGARVYSPHAVRTMDPTLSPLGRAFYSGVERLLALRSGRFVAGSAHEVEELCRIGVPRDRITLLDFGIRKEDVPLSREEARSEYGLEGDGLLLGFVGRLDWQKAPERAIRSLARLGRPDTRLALVGDGELAEGLWRTAREEGVADRVLFLGFQDGQRIMPAFDLLIMPSRYESSPYVLLEAIMAGVPILTTPVGMAEQLVGDDGAGTLVANTDDPEPWAQAIARQAEPERLAATRRALTALQSTRSLDAMIRQIEAIYERAAPQPIEAPALLQSARRT
jgi:glycosyltransferase involved in cell wall biosynthesis